MNAGSWNGPQGASVCHHILPGEGGGYSFCHRTDLKPEILFPGAEFVTKVPTPWDPTLSMRL